MQSRAGLENIGVHPTSQQCGREPCLKCTTHVLFNPLKVLGWFLSGKLCLNKKGLSWYHTITRTNVGVLHLYRDAMLHSTTKRLSLLQEAGATEDLFVSTLVGSRALVLML